MTTLDALRHQIVQQILADPGDPIHRRVKGVYLA